jgi:hypothetical protein
MRRIAPCRQIRCVLIGLAATVPIGLGAPAPAAVLTQASFQEYVGIAWYSAQGGSDSAAESVSLTVTPDQTDNRGGGTGYATADNVLPLTAAGGLSLFGGSNPSGLGGTAYVQTSYQFVVEPLAAGLPTSVPILLSASGSVTVDTSLTEFIGTTFARINYPGGQREARNCDAYGCYEGDFAFDDILAFAVPADTARTITFYVYSHGQGFTPDFFYNSTASVHASLQIDPGFTFKDQFRLVYSEGVLPTPGDVDGDGHVDVSDLLYLVYAFGSATGDANYNPACDFNHDGAVDVEDLLWLVLNFGT